MEEINFCPVCNSDKQSPYLAVKDYTVTKTYFTIVMCNGCGFKFTSPRPSIDELAGYYKSESYVSHTNTKKGLVNKLYHLVRSYTLIKKLQLIMHYGTKKGSIIDYGCGAGFFLKTCKDNGWLVHGYEPDENARQFIKENHSISVFGNTNELTLTLKDQKVDCISMWHVLEHVSDLKGLFNFFNSSLKDNGKIFVAVPNCNSFDAKHYGKFWAAYDVPRHLYHFSPNDIKTLFKNEGYKHVKTLPMVFDAFYVSMLSEKYKGSFFGFLKALWFGLYSNLLANRSGETFSSQIYIFEKTNY